jgi:hypothetical protein
MWGVGGICGRERQDPNPYNKNLYLIYKGGPSRSLPKWTPELGAPDRFK